jgi:hypothetical protein
MILPEIQERHTAIRNVHIKLCLHSAEESSNVYIKSYLHTTEENFSLNNVPAKNYFCILSVNFYSHESMTGMCSSCVVSTLL